MRLIGPHRVSRRALLTGASLLGLGAAGSIILAACGEEAPTEAAPVVEATPEPTKAAPTGPPPPIPEIPQVDVTFASFGAIDAGTYIVIGLDRGWDKDIGIRILPEPAGLTPGVDKLASILAAGDVDIASGGSQFALAGYETNPEYVSFAHVDVFLGFAFMVDPSAGFKTADDFAAEGLSGTEVVKATMEQFRGKTLATFNEAGILGFINVALEIAGLTLDDIELVTFDADSKILAEMVAGRADFSVGSAPGRISMTLEGFTPVLGALDIAKFGEASPESKALRSIFHDGLATTREYWEANHDTVFRFASLMYRIVREMVENPDETIPAHVDFYNSSFGATLTPEDVKIIYEELDPFVKFEDQDAWYLDEFRSTNPFHYCNVIESHIKLWEEQDVLPKDKWKCEDVTIALDLFGEFKEREANSAKLIADAQGLVSQNTPQANELLDKAESHRDAYNFLDAERFAEAAIEWAKYEGA